MRRSTVSRKPRKANPWCVDFANTQRWHASRHPEETLTSYDALVGWGQRVGLIASGEAGRLLREAVRHPRRARQALGQAKALRKAIYRLFVALIRGQPTTATDLEELNRRFAITNQGARVTRRTKGFAMEWPTDKGELDGPLGPIARSAAELLLSGAYDRVGQCADDRGCGWLFLDTSKNRGRRWCDITDCGNRAKQRRHVARMSRKPTR